MLSMTIAMREAVFRIVANCCVSMAHGLDTIYAIFFRGNEVRQNGRRNAASPLMSGQVLAVWALRAFVGEGTVVSTRLPWYEVEFGLAVATRWTEVFT